MNAITRLFRRRGRQPGWGAARWDHPGESPARRDYPVWPDWDITAPTLLHPDGADAERGGEEMRAPGNRTAEHPPWATAPIPVLAGPSTLGGYYAAENIRGQQAAGRLALDVPEDLVRPYAPEPPAPMSLPASYPPLPSLAADYRELPLFQSTVRDACTVGLRGLGIRVAKVPVRAPDYARPLRALHADLSVEADAAERAFASRYLVGAGVAA